MPSQSRTYGAIDPNSSRDINRIKVRRGELAMPLGLAHGTVGAIRNILNQLEHQRAEFEPRDGG